MEEKNEKKKKTLFLLLAVLFLVAVIGGTYAYFSVSASNNSTITGQTQDINNNSLRLSVTKVNFNGINTSLVPSNDLVPAFFGLNNSNNLNVASPSRLGLSNVQDMIQNKCVNTTEGYTGCHVYKIAISANQDITHANLLLGLTVNNHGVNEPAVVNKNQWGYVVFTASDNNDGATGALGSGTQTAIADGVITNLALNSAGHGAPAAIGDGLVSSPTDNRIDIHNNQGLIGCNSAGLPQEVVYYLLVYVNDTDISQNTLNDGTGNSNYAVGSYSGTLQLQALGGSVRANFGPEEEDDGFVYTINIYDEEVEGNNLITLNQPFPAGISRLTEEQVQGQKSIYLKHKLDASDYVEESYVEFIINDTLKAEWKTNCTGTEEEVLTCEDEIDNLVNGTYFLRGGIDESELGTGNQPVYEANVDVLKTAFNYEEQPGVCNDFAYYFDCAVSGLYADADSDGGVVAVADSWNCNVGDVGDSGCGE